MRRLKNYTQFHKILETWSVDKSVADSEPARRSTVGVDLAQVKKVILDAKSMELDLKDEEIQKALCQDLMKQFDDNMNNKNFQPEVDLEKVQAQVQTQSKNESKINETHGHGLMSDVLHLSIEILEKLEDLEFLKHKGGVAHGHGMEHEHEEGGISASEKEKQTALEFLKKMGISAIKTIIKFFKMLLNAALWILGLIEKAILWILRNIFGLSHKKTTQGTKMILAGITIGLLIFFTLPAIGSGVALASATSLLPILFTLGGKLMSAGSVIRGIASIFVNTYKAKAAGGGKETTTSLEFLDKLEKIKGRKISLTPAQRSRLEQIEYWLKNHKKQDEVSKIYDEILKDDLDVITLDKIPFFNKLYKGVKVEEKDLDDFENFAHNPQI